MINRHFQLFFSITFIICFLLPFSLFGDSENDIAYRDYLISILITIPTRGSSDPNDEFIPRLTDEEVRDLVLQYLRDTLKQNFETTDTRKRSIPALGIPIVTRILREDMNLSSSQIPEQDDYSDYEYLGMLIELTGNTPGELSSRYFFNFNRSGLETSTLLKETISTLQQFMRDGKFGPKAEAGSLFSPTAYNPFFFYQDEWNEQKDTPYFPENHYAL